MNPDPDPGRDGGGYYRTALSGSRLRRCYDIAPPRVRQYLDAELAHTSTLVSGASRVLELGCGYGRALRTMSHACRFIVGIDTSQESLALAHSYLNGIVNCRLACMDAATPGFRDQTFDAVICIQNGISAFHLDPDMLVRNALRQVRPGGIAIFSTYAAQFWPHRLEWFVRQSDEHLIGEIDWTATREGQIRCRDGFTATTFTPAQFDALARRHKLDARVEVVDESSVFWVLGIV
ncbi:MAG: class I SAM-dependent methyltransferase [Candidatus Zixiibacteriota bacterium]